MTAVAVTRETLNLTNESTTAEIREVTTHTTSWVEVVTTGGELIVSLDDQDCSNLINALTNVWRARMAAALETLKETA